MAVGAGGLSPAEDASGPARHLVALRSLSREVVVRGLDGAGLRVLLVVVVVVVLVPASPTAAAAAAATLLPLASLAKPLEVVAVLGGMGMPVVVDAEGAIIFLLGVRGWSGSARLASGSAARTAVVLRFSVDFFFFLDPSPGASSSFLTHRRPSSALAHLSAKSNSLTTVVMLSWMPSFSSIRTSVTPAWKAEMTCASVALGILFWVLMFHACFISIGKCFIYTLYHTS